MNQRRHIRRVDIQVSIFTAIVVILSVSCAALFSYLVTYRDTIHSLQDTVYSICSYLDTTLDKSSFLEINSLEDKNKNAYQETAELLTSVKNITGVRYLYTAKMNDKGELIYGVDGLDPASEDFRNPGDLIEPEIQNELLRALGGEVILPDNILDTEWGKIFISYFPIHGDDRTSVIGVIGIEIAAEHQYNTYLRLRIFVPCIILLACIICVIIAVLFFRRISNPSYKDMSNTDYLTQLKNRNAYDIVLKNIDARHQHHELGVILVDLNYLKKVNDTLGHEFGDQYLKLTAETLMRVIGKHGVPYRIGGDEFAILVPNTYQGKLEQLVFEIERDYAIHRLQCSVFTSLAVGYAIFDPAIEDSIRQTSKRADTNMYQRKRKMHEQHENAQ